MTYRDPNKLELLKSCKATVMTNDFELNIPVNNSTSEISVKWGVNIIVFSCSFNSHIRTVWVLKLQISARRFLTTGSY